MLAGLPAFEYGAPGPSVSPSSEGPAPMQVARNQTRSTLGLGLWSVLCVPQTAVTLQIEHSGISHANHPPMTGILR